MGKKGKRVETAGAADNSTRLNHRNPSYGTTTTQVMPQSKWKVLLLLVNPMLPEARRDTKALVLVLIGITAVIWNFYEHSRLIMCHVGLIRQVW